MEAAAGVKQEEVKREILNIPALHHDHSAIKEEPCSGDDAGFGQSEAPTGFVCHHCGFETGGLDDMRRHMRRHRGQFVCVQVSHAEEVGSGEAFFSRTRRKIIHAGEKPFLCGECDYRAGKLWDLTKHRKVHTGERPFRCDQCDYRASRSGDLTKHKVVHAGTKPFSCGRCEYKTGRLGNLTRHMIVHTGERPYPCNRCDYRAGRLGELKRHGKVHADECGYRAGRSSELTKHKATHAEVKPFVVPSGHKKAHKSEKQS